MTLGLISLILPEYNVVLTDCSTHRKLRNTNHNPAPQQASPII